MESTRLNKISRLLQKELGDYFQKNASISYNSAMISVTVVRVSPDLSHAKVYLSVFPSEKSETVYALITESKRTIRHTLAARVKQQLRKTPELEFFLDDSLEYAQRIDDLLK